MPTTQQHLDWAERNERFAESISALPVRFPDWEITTLFYSALHYIDALLATRSEFPKSHKRRLDAIALMPGLKDDYSSLYERSMDARYRMISFNTETADALRTGAFLRVRDEILSLLRNRP